MPLNVDKISTGSLSVNGTDITGNAPYKVYTALLTQSGIGNTTGINSGPLTKGVTYLIQVDGGDFTNVGAPNNNAGTYFVATESITPTSYGGNALLYNTGAPVVTVLENTIGNIWFSYNGIGGYLLYRDSDFIPEKVFAILTNNLSGNIGLVGDNMALGFECYPNAPYIAITSTTNGVATDGVLYNTPIEIRVYN
jgi:hypothetical protein